VIRSILITKSNDDQGELAAFCASEKIGVLYHSFLTFSRVVIAEIPSVDVLFFSSKRAVDFFLEQATIPASTKIACIGEGTKNHLEKLGYNVAYVGQHAGNPLLVSKDFADWLGNKTCSVILAKDSKKTITSYLNPSKTTTCVVYETTIARQKFTETFDCIIFTSPSNAEGFLKDNAISEKTKIIAWGETTQNYLIDQKIAVWKTLKMAKEEEVVFLISTM